MSMLTLSSALALSGILPVSYAAAETKSFVLTEQVEAEQSLENNVLDMDKEKLIAKVKSLFPNQFNSVSSKDFHTSFNSARRGFGVDTYYLHFYKDMGMGKQMNGHFEFASKDLSLVSFYYDPADKKDALFPAKVTKEEAQKIAVKFLENLNLKDQYRLSEEDLNFYSNMNRPLTEPVLYQFTYDKLKNGVPVQNENVNISVLGNGEVTQFYNGYMSENKAVFESKDQLISKEEALKIINENLQLDLHYLIDYNYMTNTASVKLTYVPNPAIVGIHAKTKEFKIGDKFYRGLPKAQEIKLLQSENGGKLGRPISKEAAKALAEKLLKPKKDNVKLTIEGIEEIERDGIKIYSIRYMYYSGSGGHGSSIDINKETGEIINYYNQERDFDFMDEQENQNIKAKLTEEEALKKAMDYLQQYAPSSLSQHAYPLEGAGSGYQKAMNEYYFNFPRVKDGMIVSGNGINVSVSAEDGELYSLNVNYNKVDNWPDVTKAADRNQALEAIKENINVRLIYAADAPMANEYRLVYTINQKNLDSYFDALSGTWQRFSHAGEKESKDQTSISHPWASDELNFLHKANIIKAEDVASFNADRPVTRGEALEILYKSLATYYDYPGFYNEDKPSQPTFENINSNNPLFMIIERAAQQKIIDSSVKTFNTEEKLTKEELAYWYARTLGLEIVANKEEIYNMNFADTKEMNEKYKGHIALVNGLGLLTKDANGKFDPKKEVTLAELAVSNVRLAKIAAEMNVDFR